MQTLSRSPLPSYNDAMSWIVPPDTLGAQIVTLLLLALPIACVVRTVVFEEIFREPREWCVSRSKACRTIVQRKFYYLFTCEYCFSHYVTLIAMLIVPYKLLLNDWRGHVLGFFALVLIANVYLNLYSRLRVDITQAKIETKKMEQEVGEKDESETADERR